MLIFLKERILIIEKCRMCGIRLWSFVEKIHNRAGCIPEVHTDEVSNRQNTPAATMSDRGVLYKKEF